MEDLKNYSPYCPECGACGEDGCCSAMMCKHSPNGDYCEYYLRELRFGYLMFKDMWELIKGEEEKKKLDEIFHKNYDIAFKEKENDTEGI